MLIYAIKTILGQKHQSTDNKQDLTCCQMNQTKESLNLITLVSYHWLDRAVESYPSLPLSVHC